MFRPIGVEKSSIVFSKESILNHVENTFGHLFGSRFCLGSSHIRSHPSRIDGHSRSIMLFVFLKFNAHALDTHVEQSLGSGVTIMTSKVLFRDASKPRRDTNHNAVGGKNSFRKELSGQFHWMEGIDTQALRYILGREILDVKRRIKVTLRFVLGILGIESRIVDHNIHRLFLLDQLLDQIINLTLDRQVEWICLHVVLRCNRVDPTGCCQYLPTSLGKCIDQTLT
mmetsp:Transcript_939/g.2288  ORF Transcript_939/g.2288 Transcript_939/m.2288 type:complete len:226 (-) Transcript_939:128-805(-)